MTSIQDVSFQLMQSPQELASWKFPLSQILEAYFDLLPEPCKIHYGEAALVIQNSVNAYVRRLEDLYGETTCLCQKLITEIDDNTKTSHLQGKRSKKKLIDFNQFELMDFDKVISKNVNLKIYREKSIKFLHRCFSQLENSDAKLQIHVLDIHGDLIGKKYDFRCNQKITRNGILIEEFIPKDFTNVNVEDMEDMDSENSAEKNLNYLIEDVTVTYSRNINDSVNSFANKKEKSTIKTNNFLDDNCQDNYTRNSCNFPTNVIGLQDESIVFSQELEESSTTHCDNIDGHRIKKIGNSSKIYSSQYAGIDHANVEIQVPSITNMPSEGRSFKNNIQVRRNAGSNEFSNQDFVGYSNSEEENDFYVTQGFLKTNDTRAVGDGLGNLSKVVDSSICILRRSKRYKIPVSNESNLLSRVTSLKPIPFKSGIPEKIITTRKKFQLPCHLKVLKFRLARSNKKSLNRKSRMPLRSNKEKVAENEENISTSQSLKMSLYSPSRQQMYSMKEEDQKEFRRNFDDIFKIGESFKINYDPVTTLTMDLLGFHPNYNNENSQLTYSETRATLLSEGSSLSSEYVHSPTHSSNDITPPISPSSLDIYTNAKDARQRRENISLKCTEYFQNLVRSKIKKIYEELDLHNAEDQKVARWHEEIKPILKEAEQKPPFQIHEYGSRILHKLQKSHRKLQFDEIISEEPPSEIARYFSATLQLASTNDLNINTNKDPHKSIELILVD